MDNFSTLIYLVNSFQTELSNSDIQLNKEVNGNSYTKMENDCFEPSKQSIKNILDFACAYDVLETENAGCFEMILN